MNLNKLRYGIVPLTVAALSSTGFASKPKPSAAPNHASGEAKSGTAKFEVAGQPEFFESAMTSAGGVKLAVAPDKKVYALVHSKSYTSPSNELSVYLLEGDKWVPFGQPRFAKEVAGGDLTITADGQVLVACSKGIFRFEAADQKFHLGLGTGRGYVGFSWGDESDAQKWEKRMPGEALMKVRSDSKNHIYVATTFSGRATLLEYNKEMAEKWTSDKRCNNCDESDVQVELYPVGKPIPKDGRTGTEFSPGMNGLTKPGVVSMNLALDDKDQAYVAFDPEPNGVRWGFEVHRWDASKNTFIPLGVFKGDDEGNPNGGYSDGKAEQLAFLVHGNDIMVAYREDSNQKSDRQWKASAMKWTGSTWEHVGPQGFSGGPVNDLTLAANSKGDVFLAYDLSPVDTLGHAQSVVMKLDRVKNSWTLFGVASEPSQQVENTHMVIGADDTLYVGFRDNRTGKMTVKRTKT